MDATKTWTEEEIVSLLDRSDAAVERAIVAIYEKQTADEKQASHTRHDNTVGFRQNHAPRMSFYARLIKGGKHLYPAQVSLARRWMKMYRRQLCGIANAKVATSVPAARALPAVTDVPREPPLGSWAETARMMAKEFPDFDWDAWKDQMKEQAYDDAPPSGEPV